MWIRAGKAVEPHPGDCPLGFALAAGFAVSVIGCLLASLAAPPHQTTTRLVVLALVMAGSAAAIRNLRGAVLTAGMTWSLYLGFLVDQTGELHWHGIADLVRLGVLIAVALAGSARWPINDRLSARSARWARRPEPGPRAWATPPSSPVRAPGDSAERGRLIHAAGAGPSR
jgi:hypothetical protein